MHPAMSKSTEPKIALNKVIALVSTHHFSLTNYLKTLKIGYHRW